MPSIPAPLRPRSDRTACHPRFSEGRAPQPTAIEEEPRWDRPQGRGADFAQVLVAAALLAGLAGCGADRGPLGGGSVDGAVTSGDAAPRGRDAAVDTTIAAGCRATCAVRKAAKPPFKVTFRFHNGGEAPVFLRSGCQLQYDVTSCEVCYAESFGPTFACGLCDCADKSCRSDAACGPCETDHGVALAPGATKEVPWDAVKLVVETRTGYSCGTRTFLEAGVYRVRVPVYGSDAAATAGKESRLVTTDFDLPAEGNLVTVELAGR